MPRRSEKPASETKSPEVLARQRAFGEALAGARAAAGLTQEDFAEKMGLKQSTVSGWENGLVQPDAVDHAFRAEQVLRVAPGSLSRHLGYLPPDAVAIAEHFEDAIQYDPALDADARELLLNTYRMVTGRGRRGRPKG
jgi:transcriptional regulator with XRE-family HTH domain